ncbi:MAG: isoleucine--tRNA ligase [Candidatus Bathyarchaeia archaeon]
MTVKFKADSKLWLTQDYRPLELEQKVREFWEKNRIAEKLEKARLQTNRGALGYVEGPPTLNGIPHVGHARGRVMKDLRYRWKTMQGYYIPFWAGWDCQGLPVELEVEKRLGVKNKRELLERVGEEQFVQECKKTIMKYHKEWTKLDTMIGIFINHDEAYWTYYDSYIEREWQYLKRAWKQGLLEEGYYVVAYCPGCQTSLSSAEVGYEDSYKLVEDPSLYFKFKVANSQSEYFLIWTTMPFTLVTDTMLAVHPEAEYAKVKVNTETWIMAKQRVEPVMQELGVEKYEITETIRGNSLENTKYVFPFIDLLPVQAELETKHELVHRVILEEFVDVNTATGVVHQSPGNGEEDFFAAQKRSIPIFAPFDDEAKFTEDAGVFKGIFARNADQKVVEELRKRGLLVEVKTIQHEYPTCWRSHHKLVWLARKEYFLRTDKINPKVLEAAENVEYFYESPKNRFLAFLKEGKPWCISRERVWGAPLPIWKCEKCGTKTLVASKKELAEKASEKPSAAFELHKPWVDRITFKCEKCGGVMRREDFVLDTWHNSGASPYARFTDDEFTKYVPVDFLTEGIDQTRGWANSLLLENVILTGKAEAPYKAFLFQGLAQDAKGRKMSKSLGNMVEANKLLEEYSADVCRFYMLRKCSPEDFINFDLNELSRRPYQVLSTLYHLGKFLLQNAKFDGFNPEEHTLEWALCNSHLKKPDYWLLSKLQKTIETYTAKLETCQFNFALAILEDYVIEILSRLYVPMIRKELWTDAPETLNRRLAVYATLWNVLKTVTLLFNPVTPFLCEAMYQQIHKTLDKTLLDSVNFEKWPIPDEKLVDQTLEKDFDILLKYVSLTYSARQKTRLKRRWPLMKAVLVGPKNAQNAVRKLEDLFLELANIKAVEYADTPDEIDFETRGEGSLASENNLYALVDTRRDEALQGEGLMRDLARRVQALRRELGFTPTQILDAVYLSELDAESTKMLKPHLEIMADLVRARNVQLQRTKDEVEAEWHEWKLDGKKVYIAIP